MGHVLPHLLNGLCVCGLKRGRIAVSGLLTLTGHILKNLYHSVLNLGEVAARAQPRPRIFLVRTKLIGWR
jgi:hypothetical protein